METDRIYRRWTFCGALVCAGDRIEDVEETCGAAFVLVHEYLRESIASFLFYFRQE